MRLGEITDVFDVEPIEVEMEEDVDDTVAVEAAVEETVDA